MMTIQETRALTGTEDPLLGALYMESAFLAVNVKGDRNMWNRQRALQRRKDFDA